jgi:hypothetical protein
MKPSAAAALLLCAFALVALAHGCSFHDNPTDVTLAAGSKGGQTLAGYQVSTCRPVPTGQMRPSSACLWLSAAKQHRTCTLQSLAQLLGAGMLVCMMLTELRQLLF